MGYKCLTNIIFLISLAVSPSLYSQTENYNEALVGTYTLPDPLITSGGKQVKDAKAWTTERRPEILQLFKSHVYGEFPRSTNSLRFKVTSIDTKALQGKATKKQITIYFTASANSPSMDVLLYLPNHVKKTVPVFVGLNFFGNHSVSSDTSIILSQQWMMHNEAYHIKGNKATQASRGVEARRWPIDSIIAQGYGVATAYYGDLEPDHSEGWKTGIRTTLKNTLAIQPEQWGAIGAWAWGLCRIMDYLETDKQVNASRVAISGHSRLGKAALWAAANDERFAMVISNNSGEGGAALARRNFGETLGGMTKKFPYWFINQYKLYAENVHSLPVDQHMLLALMAPRPLYVVSASADAWADPTGEFLGLKNTEPVYNLLKKTGLGVDKSPEIEQPVGKDIRYHIRNGNHDILLYDWLQYIKFADENLKNHKGMPGKN